MNSGVWAPAHLLGTFLRKETDVIPYLFRRLCNVYFCICSWNDSTFLRVSWEAMVQVCPRCSVPRRLLKSRMPIRTSGSGVLASGFHKSFPGGSEVARAHGALGSLVLTRASAGGALALLSRQRCGLAVAWVPHSPRMGAWLLCSLALPAGAVAQLLGVTVCLSIQQGTRSCVQGLC